MLARWLGSCAVAVAVVSGVVACAEAEHDSSRLSDGTDISGMGGASAGTPPTSTGAAAPMGGTSSVAGSGGAGTNPAGGSGITAGTSGAAGSTTTLPTAEYDADGLRERAELGMKPLAIFYHPDNGLWGDGDWWTSANQLETVIDYSRETGDPTYASQIENTFQKNQASAFEKWGYYDDDGWWAVAWIKAYDLTHREKYLDMAKAIFARMTGGWDTKCGGGIYWASAKAGVAGLKNKNAIANALFLQVAVMLHQRTPDDLGAGSYLDWADREWNWFSKSGMVTDQNQVVDGLSDLVNCKATGPVFTYNQGVLLGALVELSEAKQSTTLLDKAAAIAQATMSLMSNADGVLKEAPCGGDVCVQFKGIFMRNLVRLYRARPSHGLREYMRNQSDALWLGNRNAINQFGYEWHMPFDKPTPGRQSSALDALIGSVASSSMNLALGATGEGPPPCTVNEGPERAFDGSSTPGSKWCAGGPGGQTLDVDLGAEREIVGFRVRHAGAGGENPAWNTRDFEISVSSNEVDYTRLVTVVDNTDDVTTHMIAPVTARYLRLHISKAQTEPQLFATRIYELEAFGVEL
jgi:predicted alpha-1,6-mannanase (GH76 family)